NQAAFPQHAGTGQPGPGQAAPGQAAPGQAAPGQASTGQASTGQAQPAGSGTRPLGSWTVPGAPRPEIFAFSGLDRETVAAQLARVTRGAAGPSHSETGGLPRPP